MRRKWVLHHQLASTLLSRPPLTSATYSGAWNHLVDFLNLTSYQHQAGPWSGSLIATLTTVKPNNAAAKMAEQPQKKARVEYEHTKEVRTSLCVSSECRCHPQTGGAVCT